MSSSGNTPAAAAASASAPAASTATSKASASTAASGGTAFAASTTATSTTKAATASKKKKAPATKAAAATTTTTKKKPARKRKPPSSKTSASVSNQAVWNDARAAASDLAQQRALGAARRADPLWYRIEDVIPVNNNNQNNYNKATTTSTMNAFLSEQMQVVVNALEKNGLTCSDLTPQALACLSEHARRYTQELLEDAQDFADTVGRSEITRADLVLASEMRHDHPVAISTQLPQLNLIAKQINRKPLPPIPSHCYSGIVLPPKHNQLTTRTFDIVSGALMAQKMSQSLPQPPGSTTTTNATSATPTVTTAAVTTGGNNSKRKSSASSSSSYGASRGRQIAVKLKETSTTTSSTGETGGATTS